MIDQAQGKMVAWFYYFEVLLPIPEVARQIDVSPNTLREWIEAAKLRDGTIRYDIEHIQPDELIKCNPKWLVWEAEDGHISLTDQQMAALLGEYGFNEQHSGYGRNVTPAVYKLLQQGARS